MNATIERRGQIVILINSAAMMALRRIANSGTIDGTWREGTFRSREFVRQTDE
ncbi:hypothetical protein [Microvirga sp. VF16]|uniref:hypothetical protein n=1 Tax=Microvirga sp. VF16 TaxID=2807101 RepID=UPI00193D6AEC|nr:hypothetical protein [Microvirga sp. VF16]QRM34687.1 hypothetical protein JO965_41145 [Microvirga sp. VF16]